MILSVTDPNEEQSGILIRMARLIAKERLGELTDPEREELNGWLDANEENRSLKDQLTPENITRLLDSYQSFELETEGSLAAFHDAHLVGMTVVPMGQPALAEPPATPVVKMRQRTMRTGWWVAAAVAVPLVVAAVWLGSKRKDGPGTVIAGVDTKTIQPGRNAATLTLANGKMVTLDTATTGQVIQRGAVVARYEDGKVAYDAKSRPEAAVEFNTLATARGGQYQLVLPDGSKVWLNAASSIRYPTAFDGKERKVELTGEGYFEVMSKKDQPFVVSVEGMEVKVLGTEFDVMAYPEEAAKKTTLVQGAVKVEDNGKAEMLKPNEQSVVTKSGELSVTSDVNVESVIAWKQGFFQFSHADLQTIMRQIARWYDVDVVYERKDLSGEYGGRISRKLNLSEVISLLEGNGGGHFKIDGRKLTVLP